MSVGVRYFLIFSLLFFSVQASAGLSLSQAIIHFEDDGKRSEDIIVFNQGDETLYIRVEPSIIVNPGTSQETREIYHDPKTAGLLVTPQRFVIPAGARKRLRFVRMDEPVNSIEDKVFRVLVKPEVGEIQSEQTAVKIIVAYEVLVISQPKQAKPLLESSFQGNILKLTNSGNTNVLLQKGVQCPLGQSSSDEENQCVELTGKRIYAKSDWQIELPFTTPVTYQISVGMQNDSITFDPASSPKK